MFTVSKDDGDLTHLCMQCAHLESEWNLLTIKISWFVLDYLIKASKRISAKIVNVSNYLFIYLTPIKIMLCVTGKG